MSLAGSTLAVILSGFSLIKITWISQLTYMMEITIFDVTSQLIIYDWKYFTKTYCIFIWTVISTCILKNCLLATVERVLSVLEEALQQHRRLSHSSHRQCHCCRKLQPPRHQLVSSQGNVTVQCWCGRIYFIGFMHKLFPVTALKTWLKSPVILHFTNC